MSLNEGLKDLYEGDIVVWDPQTSGVPVGKGVVRGIATIGQALIERRKEI